MKIFRTFEHNGKVLQLATYETEPSAGQAAKTPSMSVPGAGRFGIGPIHLSAKKIAAGKKLKLTARIKGKNIAYIYSDLLFHDKDLNQFYGPVAREYVQADRNKDSLGVSYPDWEDGIRISIKLSPSLHLLTDGVGSAFGFLIPEGYGSSDGWVDGLYTAAGGATRCRARITFDKAGNARKLVAYKEQGGLAIPHELTLTTDDQFAPFVQILNQPADENQKWQVTTGISTPLTFRGQPLRWVAEPLMPGDYLVGLLVQDLDGDLTRQYAPLTIK